MAEEHSAEHHSEAEPENDHSALEELFWTRLHESRMNFTQADIDFMLDMIPHHAQALIMSRLAEENDAGPSVRMLAAKIKNSQEDEIATMQKWLRDRDQAWPMVHLDGLDMMIHMQEPETEMAHGHDGDHDQDDHDGHNGHHHHHDHDEDDHDGHQMMGHDHHDMPGMLTQAQLEELAAARGDHFDYLFLKFMIEHHEGAVWMVQQLFDADGAGNDSEAFDLASDIHAEQVTEIELMRQMLENMSD
ncbi:MAG: DUF305 domain-containing protein [Balneolaceae bacterium]|nr:DUF305 domain-containing protein [Balneolaceae bacterium]MCH8549644.1 DUF305 domain-containing protein [Balneolaceae bacterium]